MSFTNSVASLICRVLSSVEPSLRRVQILGLMVVRKLLDLMFSQHDLAWLDDILPDKDKKKKEDEKKKKKERKAAEPESDEEVRETLTHSCCNLQRWQCGSLFLVYLNVCRSICCGCVVPGFVLSD